MARSSQFGADEIGGLEILSGHDGFGGEPLSARIGMPMEVGSALRIGVGIAAAVGKVHQRGLIHKDIKPANILVARAGAEEVRLTGFGVASRLLRERQPPDPPEVIAGTLAYMAPEQTGRMNRSVDSRSDLYALGVTLYEMLTGSLPFTASDPMEWVHCHIARNPVPPGERVDTVPAQISAIVMKLLAKTAEERYQTAGGVERDLRRCLAEWGQGSVADFPLGEEDAPDRLLIPEKLYGREHEVETLLASFDRIVKSGAPELLLVSGYSGIGKSSVVNEVHKVLVPPRGLFAAGKFDQYKRDIPYATLGQAFHSLVRPLLSKSDTELGGWRAALMDALGANGRLITDLVPELKLIIGEPPPVAELSPRDAQWRFQQVFRRFIGVFARPEHPLALFLDDLQWLDAATLDLIEDVLTGSALRHLMLIGAYRDNEVDAGHPLRRKLEAIKAAGGKVAEITLGPLGRTHLGQLIADALRCDPERAAPLAQLVHAKTGGNPFFGNQFIGSLAEEGVLAFDHQAARWSWNLDRIHAMRYTDNIADLMARKLTRLPLETQQALQILACLGHVATVRALSIALGTTAEQVHEALWPAIRDELIERSGSSYKFAHDRIHEAAYSLLEKESRAATHLRIGRLLAASTPPERREAEIFEIVNQLDRGADLVTADQEREQLAELNLLAGRRARASSAYASALRYFVSGAGLLSESAWEHRHDLVFALELHRAECEFLTGALAPAETRLAMLSRRAASTVEQAAVACLRLDLYPALDQIGRALDVGLDYLRLLGIDWSRHPTDEAARQEYERIWSKLAGRTIEELIDLPSMTDPPSLATLDVLIHLWPAALFTDINLFTLTLCRAVNLSLEHGNSDSSCIAYVRLGAIAGSRFGDYQAALRFGHLGYELVEQRGLKRFQARTYMIFGCYILPLTKKLSAAREVLHRAFASATEGGDLIYAAYSAGHLVSNMLVTGDPLVEVLREAEQALAFARRMRFDWIAIDGIGSMVQSARMLRGLTRKLGSFDDERFSELQTTRRFQESPNLWYVEGFYWIRKLQGCVLAGDHAAAVDAALQARRLPLAALSTLEVAEYHFYAALARAAFCDSLAPAERQQHLQALAAHHREIETWARHCPENFANRAALVGAEVARLEGRDYEAMQLYEQAIRSARDHGFVQNEGLAYEAAARFYSARGLETFAEAYLSKARGCYLRWGADGKVQLLDRLYPQLAGAGQQGPATTAGTPVQQLDVTSVTKASQAVSSEIVLPKLIERLMKIAIENAGADRGLLILPTAGEHLVHAEARASGDLIDVTIRQEPITRIACPQSIIRYVIRTRENVILDDASKPNLFSGDDYLRDRQSRSILCLPLVKQRNLTGVLLLENALTSHAFTPARTAVLELLAAQAAISLENAGLYRDLKQSEVSARRMLDYLNAAQRLSQTGSFMADVLADEHAWSDELYRIFELELGTRISVQSIRAMIHLEDLPAFDAGLRRWAREEAEFNQDFRIVTAGGKTKYLQSSGRVIDHVDGRSIFIGAIQDVTERRLGQAALDKARAEIAHMARVMALSAMSASIAHEIGQPLTGILTNARVCLNMLEAVPPDLDGALLTARRTMRDAARASDVLERLRAMFARKQPKMEQVDLNDTAREVLALSSSELTRDRVTVRTALSDQTPPVFGDRIQLQQVLLNLVLNAADAMTQVHDRPRELLVATTRPDDNRVIMSVSDSGLGIDPRDSEKLFEAFYTTKAKGMGIGLAVSRSIIESHGGRIWAAANDGPGATFSFSIPRLPDA